MKTRRVRTAALMAVGAMVFAGARALMAAGSGEAVAFAPGERAIPAAQGTATNPGGDTITITTKCLRYNGEPKMPVMGEMHYSRVPADEWPHYVRTMKAGGLTMIATYVFWCHHEEKEGAFDFTGQRDLSRFLSVCEAEKMPVVLRIGPWDHGECVEGGFPEWLIDRCGTKRLRTTDPAFMDAVERFWTRLYKEVDGHLFKQGGCVVGIQIENECRGPWPYMQALKDLARRVGFDVPFYTRTGWPAMQGRVAYGELLPLFGDYADGFWERNLKEPSPGNYLRAFRFTNVRASANIATEQLPQSLADDAATAQYPYFTCELGGGMPSSYHRRVRVTPMDTYAMALVRLGSGSNLLGYYMYAGGTNPNRPQEGVFFNERQSSRYTNHNDLPPFSYEFYGPISEFGETTEVYHLLKPLHAFCANFAADFALADPEIIDEHNARRGPFLFHSDYVRCHATNAVPYIVPQNWKTRLGTIKSATAQPVRWEGDTLVMMKIPGLEPKVEFDGEPFKVEFEDHPLATKTTKDTKSFVNFVPFVAKKPFSSPREVKIGPRGVAQQPTEADWANAAVWEVELPETLADGTPAPRILEVDYLGDVARVYVDDVPVADDFYKGLPLRCALWRIPKGKITVRILPWTDSPLIYVEPPYRPAETGAKIRSARLVAAPATSCRKTAATRPAYLFAYFRGQKDGLHLAYSYDGLKWTALNGNKSVLAPAVGKDRLMRDPSIAQGPDGMFHMVWTSSWHDQIIGYASSPDLIHWSEQRAIPVMAHEPTARNSWAPELTYDDATGAFYIYWATTIPDRHAPIAGMDEKEDGLNHRIYLTTTKDFKSFTPTRLWFNPDFSAIDAALVKVPGGRPAKWMMVVKNENHTPPEKNLRVAFADDLAAGFPTAVSAPISPAGLWVEGPSPLAVGDALHVYYDVYGKGRYGLAVSTDGGATWADRSADLSLPKGIRHGTAFAVSPDVVARLIAEYEGKEKE